MVPSVLKGLASSRARVWTVILVIDVRLMWMSVLQTRAETVQHVTIRGMSISARAILATKVTTVGTTLMNVRNSHANMMGTA